MIKGSVAVGDRVVFTKRKVSSHPGPHAHDIAASPRGEEYVYEVDKLWTVVEVQGDGQFVAVTRRGKRHLLQTDDPHLRRPTLFERLRFWRRFPRVENGALAQTSTT